MTDSGFPPAVTKWTASLLQGAILLVVAAGVGYAMEVRADVARLQSEQASDRRMIVRLELKLDGIDSKLDRLRTLMISRGRH